MKKIIYTLLAVSIIFAACKKEDDTPVAVPGCMDATACNYDKSATTDDGSCILPDGCTNPAANNYDASALCDDGSCDYTVYDDLVGGFWMANYYKYDIYAAVYDWNTGAFIYDTAWIDGPEYHADSLEANMPWKLQFNEDNTFIEWDRDGDIIDNGSWAETDSLRVTFNSDGSVVTMFVANVNENSLLTKTQLYGYDTDMATYEVYMDAIVDFGFTRDFNGFTSNTTNQRKHNFIWHNEAKIMNSIKKK